MKSKHICKFISLFMLAFVFFSVIPMPVFAEEDSSNPQREEEYTFWEELAFFGVLVLGAVLSPIIAVVKGIEFIIYELAELLTSIF